MIRITFKKTETENEGDFVDYPGTTGTMPFLGDDRKMAVVKEASPGIQEVVAVLDSEDILKTEEVPEEGSIS